MQFLFEDHVLDIDRRERFEALRLFYNAMELDPQHRRTAWQRGATPGERRAAG